MKIAVESLSQQNKQSRLPFTKLNIFYSTQLLMFASKKNFNQLETVRFPCSLDFAPG